MDREMTPFALMPPNGKQRSPFRYPGGKFYARRLILAAMPPHSVYCEPFAGGASVFFCKAKARRSILNDLDGNLIECYETIRDRPEDLIAGLHGFEATKRMHQFFKEMRRPATPLARAVRFFYLNRTSFSGIMNPDHCGFGYDTRYSIPPDRWPGVIRATARKLKGVELSAEDFEGVLDGLPDGAFAFVDPPYFASDQTKIYTHSFSEPDHLRLERVLARHRERIRFLLTYDNCAPVRDLYPWAVQSAKQWTYHMSRTDDQSTGAKAADGHRGTRSEGRELFLANYRI